MNDYLKMQFHGTFNQSQLSGLKKSPRIVFQPVQASSCNYSGQESAGASAREGEGNTQLGAEWVGAQQTEQFKLLNPEETLKETIWSTFQSLLNIAHELLHVRSLMLKRFFRYSWKIFPGYDRGNWTLPHLLPLKAVVRKQAAFGQQ